MNKNQLIKIMSKVINEKDAKKYLDKYLDKTIENITINELITISVLNLNLPDLGRPTQAIVTGTITDINDTHVVITDYLNSKTYKLVKEDVQEPVYIGDNVSVNFNFNIENYWIIPKTVQLIKKS